ncbi:DUF2490 domain-containing protein [Polaribacter sp. Hel1_85]|uniref:DUF2490 domain-containing protein n=1 Tax=Polaribacter sp. Hel1_85 TaxID=1250005 RepID=UPI00052CA657|nr:DUF2490 domain-containing protein [Polaribacter sp. Hel1_85]KGL63616.1 hypothetical protein PHEL85_0653 [Polaribacter sp. Hel1_85]
MKIKKKIKQSIVKLMLLITILFAGKNYAQTDADWASWNTVGVEYELNKKWSFGLEEQFRLKENISVIDNYFTQLTADYKLFKGFKLGAGVRYIRDNDNQGNIQGYENHFRFQIDAMYKHEINDFKIGYRLRYQNKNELGVSYDEGDYANQNIRFKTSLEYNIKNWKLDPKFSAEIFNKFQEGEENGFNKFRLTLGTDYKTKNFGKIGVFYRYQKELNVDFPEATNVVGLKYIYTIKNK